MFANKKFALLVAALGVFALVLAACQPATEVVEVTRVVTETVVEEGEPVEVTRVVTENQEVVVTATPEPVEEMSMSAPDPSTYVSMTFGDIGTLDPALGYDTASNTPDPEHLRDTDLVQRLRRHILRACAGDRSAFRCERRHL
ncbi:MAG: hypothetical protein R3C44_19805 [Chloroflexota bacterium]